MFGLGMGEIVIILVLALILLGPQRLPDAAKKLGQGLREFRKATEDLKTQFETELYQDAKPQRPTLVEPAGAAQAAQDRSAGQVPGAAAGDRAAANVPLATADNVPGLEAALAEPRSTPDAATARDEAEAPPGVPAAGART